MSQFDFLKPEFPDVHEAAGRAEALANSDPRAACFYARRALELAVTWAYEHDSTLQVPYREDLSALIHEAAFRNLVGQAVFYKCRAIKDLGNQAVHSQKALTPSDSAAAVRELFHCCYWLVRTYAKGAKPAPGLEFNSRELPQPAGNPQKTRAQLQELNDALAAEQQKAIEALADQANLDEELKKARAELEAIKKANAAAPDNHDYSEEQTRELFIDILLEEAGWPRGPKVGEEFEVAGMPNSKNKGFVDYVLWGDDGKPLALVEAKSTRRDPHEGQQQAKLYADCLEAMFEQRPIIFYTNGYEHWIWDDTMYPPRQVQGFYKKDELELLIQRRLTRRNLSQAKVNEGIVDRYYQKRAILRIGEAFENEHARRALLVMATGSGKTRTVIALIDLLMRANWAKRILFLADRTALVNQAVGAFKRHLPDASPVNLVTEKEAEGRIYVSTYQTMIGLIDESNEGSERRFGPGHFDLIIIDEAHRSIFKKYGMIFDYFDSLLVGLTATPKDDVGHNTYQIFGLEDGVPTDFYPLEDAVNDGYLVPAKSVSVPLKLPTTGLIYDQLSDEEKEQFEMTDWKDRAESVLEERHVDPPAFNAWLFNLETVDKVLKHLMQRGQKVDGGDKLGKTIIFAKNHNHAEFIAGRFNKNYPKYKGFFARVIDFKVEYAQSLINDFSDPKKDLQIAISVDMLDTGIDVPQVVNLVFFKTVRSKTKFWQMIGRGTRLCRDLFGPGMNKECFYILDYCGNLEYFSENVPETNGATGASISQRLFATRLHLITALSQTKAGANVVKENIAQYGEEPRTDGQLKESILKLLQTEVEAMNTDNFIVRTKRRLVEKYQEVKAWADLDDQAIDELENEVAGLPTELASESPEAKLFDLLILRLQTAVMDGNNFLKLKRQLMDVAASLEEASTIPVIKAQLELIQDLQSESWWEDVSLIMLEQVRLRLRKLMNIIEVRKGSPVYVDFGDDLGDESEIVLPGFAGGEDFERFREKVGVFLRNHLDRPAIQKLRLNLPLTNEDLAELEQILVESGLGSAESVTKASELGLGQFVRRLVGLDREAAKAAFNLFLANKTMSSRQIDFVNKIVDYLTENGVMEARMLYESPFTDLTDTGPEGLFGQESLDALFGTLKSIRDHTVVH